MKQRYFITGTDTEVGKTAISCALICAANARGLCTAAVKPVAAGCDEHGQNEDALALMAVMSASLPYQQVNPVALAPAIAPHIAAARVGKRLRADTVAGYCQGVTTGAADFVLVEGAGGWRVPLNERETLADLAVVLGFPVILVVSMRLGCINHALLSCEAIANDGLKLAGWVANTPGETMSCYQENLATLKGLIAAPLLGEVPKISPFSGEDAAKHIDLSLLSPK